MRKPVSNELIGQVCSDHDQFWSLVIDQWWVDESGVYFYPPGTQRAIVLRHWDALAVRPQHTTGNIGTIWGFQIQCFECGVKA